MPKNPISKGFGPGGNVISKGFGPDGPAASSTDPNTLTYYAGDGAVLLLPGLTITSPGPTETLTLVEVQLTNNYQLGEDFLAATALYGITVSFNGTTGKLSMSQELDGGTVAQYQEILRTVTYEDIETETPTELTRAVVVTIDGTGVYDRDIDVLPAVVTPGTVTAWVEAASSCTVWVEPASSCTIWVEQA